MRLRVLPLLALCAHVALGNVCFMQMASAREMPHDMHAGMDMGGMHGMPAADDEGGEQPCAGGHCIVPALPESSTSTLVLAPCAIPPDPAVIAYVVTEPRPLPSVFGPPGVPIHTRTVVLRC